jgi:ABC-type dipeptide/oligopeptide/nickel transport system permease component
MAAGFPPPSRIVGLLFNPCWSFETQFAFPMLRIISRRALSLIFVLFSVTFLTFIVSYLAPGDPILNMMGGRQDPTRYQLLRHLYGLDLPWFEQYLNYLRHLLQGNLGLSFKYPERPVWDLIANGVPVSMELGLLALAFSVAVGVPAGVLSALWQNTWRDTAVMGAMLVLYSVPSFVIIPILWVVDLAFYNARLPSLPVAGWGKPEHLVLPVLVLSAANMGFIARLMRNSMLEVMRQDFTRTARAKGLPAGLVIRKHVLRNALLPLLTVLGPATAFLVTGAFVVENLFAVPGIGYLAVQAIGQRDYPVIQATTILLALAVVVMNLITDLAYSLADPRVRTD